MTVNTGHLLSFMSPCTQAVSEFQAKIRKRLLGWLRILYCLYRLLLYWLLLLRVFLVYVLMVRKKLNDFTGLINMTVVILKERVMFEFKMKLLLMFFGR